MERLLQKSKCSIIHDIFKYMKFQRRLLWSEGLNSLKNFKHFIRPVLK